jgi:chromosome segregation ATPase
MDSYSFDDGVLGPQHVSLTTVNTVNAYRAEIMRLADRIEQQRQHARYLGRTQDEQEELIAEARFGSELAGMVQDLRVTGEGVTDTLRRIIQERDELALKLDKVRAQRAELVQEVTVSEGRLAGLRDAVRVLREQREAVERENRSKCLELAEKAGEIRELRGVVDAAATFVNCAAVHNRAAYDRLQQLLAKHQTGAPGKIDDTRDARDPDRPE